jgi:hypothetical protein
MLTIKLHKLTAENFKGASFNIDLGDGDNAVITAANGVGKTRVIDAFTWLLRGKNAEGKEDFSVRPLDKDNVMIPGLVVKVEGVIAFDDEIHTLKKEQHEKVVKKTGQITGYETLCWINEVPKKVGEFGDWLEERLPEDTAKMLTDLYQFNRDIPKWGKKERRAMLLSLAGEIGTPKGFEKLLKDCNGRTVSEYRQVLSAQKKRHEQERDNIGPALNENQKTLEGLGDASDTAAIEMQRKTLLDSIAGFDAVQSLVLAGEGAREKALAAIRDVEQSRTAREYALQNDTTQVTGLVEESGQLGRGLAEHSQKVERAKADRDQKALEIANHKRIYAEHLSNRNKFKEQSDAMEMQKDPCTCSLCGQALPEDKLAGMAEKRTTELKRLAENGQSSYRAAVEENNIIQELTKSLNSFEERYQGYIAQHNQLVEKTQARIAEIQKAIETREKPKKEDDFTWKNLTTIIDKAKAELPPSSAEKLQGIATSRKTLQDELTKLNTALANVDTASRTKERIKELQAKQITLSQAIADIDEQLANIGEYTASESHLIETSVNKMFQHVTFKMFDTALNGNVEETCIALLNGVPYQDMSYGQRILVGIDIINVLSKHYGISIVLFIDNFESLTYSVETNSQVIKLKAVEGQKKLKVVVESPVEAEKAK